MPVALATHFAFAFYDEVVYLAVGHLCEYGRIVPIVHFQTHRGGEITFAVAGNPVAHGAIEAKELLGARQVLLRWLYRIFSFICGGGRVLWFLVPTEAA